MVVIRTLVATEPLDSLWKISAGLVTPILLEGLRRGRKIVQGAQDAAKAVEEIRADVAEVRSEVHNTREAIGQHSAAIAAMTAQLANSTPLADLLATTVQYPLERLATAAESIANNQRSVA